MTATRRGVRRVEVFGPRVIEAAQLGKKNAHWMVQVLKGVVVFCEMKAVIYQSYFLETSSE